MSYLSNYDIITTKNSDNLYIGVNNKDTNKQYHKKIFTDDLTNQYIKSLDELYQLFQVGTNKIKLKNPNNCIIIEIFEDEDNQNLNLIIKYDMIIKFEIEIMLDKVKKEDENYKDNTEIVKLKKTVAELEKNLNYMSEIMSEMYIDSPQYKNYISENKDKITHLFILYGSKEEAMRQLFDKPSNYIKIDKDKRKNFKYDKYIKYNMGFRIEVTINLSLGTRILNTNILDEYTNLKELYYDCALAISINLTSNNKIKFSYLHLYCSGISHKINFQTHLEQISYILDKFEVSSCINIMYIINIDIILFIYNKYNGKIQIKVFTDGEFENESRLKNLDNLLVI